MLSALYVMVFPPFSPVRQETSRLTANAYSIDFDMERIDFCGF